MICLYLSCIKPFGDDDIRQIWIEVERGPVEVFGDYEEYKESGEVNNLDEFIPGKFAGAETLPIFRCSFRKMPGNGLFVWLDQVL